MELSRATEDNITKCVAGMQTVSHYWNTHYWNTSMYVPLCSINMCVLGGVCMCVHLVAKHAHTLISATGAIAHYYGCKTVQKTEEHHP